MDDHFERDDAARLDGHGDEPDPVDERSDERSDDVEIARRRVSRRHLLAGAATGTAVGAIGLPLALAEDKAAAPSAAALDPATLHFMEAASPAASPVAGAAPSPVGMVFFSPYNGAIVQAAAARLIPTDDNGPGATEAGVVYFIDRQLGSEYGFSIQRYNQGPFATGLPTQGDQVALNLRDRYRLGCAALDAYAQQLYQNGFASLAPDEQDRILTDLSNDTPKPFSATAMTTQPFEGTPGPPVDPAGQSGIGALAFFQLLLQHTYAGFFCDPLHGGNRDLVGWKLIGFPGAQMVYDQHILDYGQPFTGPFQSLADVQRLVTGGS
jgi:gluconate 2-dehydrogenase gamma chain